MSLKKTNYELRQIILAVKSIRTKDGALSYTSRKWQGVMVMVAGAPPWPSCIIGMFFSHDSFLAVCELCLLWSLVGLDKLSVL